MKKRAGSSSNSSGRSGGSHWSRNQNFEKLVEDNRKNERGTIMGKVIVVAIVVAVAGAVAIFMKKKKDK